MSTVDPDGILTPRQRRTARKHDVTPYWQGGNIYVRCNRCGGFWYPMFKVAGRWWRGWYQCPWCNSGRQTRPAR